MLNQSLSVKRKHYEARMKAVMLLSVGLTAALVLFLLVYVLAKGIPNITWELLSTSPSYLTERIGILPDILNTLYIVIATLLIVLPLGVGAAIYLTEYASNKKLVGVIEYAAETLSGMESSSAGIRETAPMGGTVTMASTPSSGSMTSPVPVRMSVRSLSATMSRASSLRRNLS